MEQAPPKKGVVERFARHGKDVGSSEVQIALLTGRILHLTEHLKVHTKDRHGNHGLLKLVSKRKKLLDYLSRSNPDNFRKLKKELNLR
ncbi:MAG: 30S ribosomal protein S15 [Betaproteobacteria bacterium AqS2]|uniref:Small ribosomal subunit protein uS15 n=1 Tax=Candidatus Amphirhobacter heronislandensis TaxID=1732024 RepID=A0A930UDE2_9GAMM|nr:30S ribosomal protein S15 [Betaproteobacteria bacterium AqS2]